MPRKPSPSSPSPAVHPVNVRLDARARDALVKAHAAVSAAQPFARWSVHRVAVAAITLGAERIADDPSVTFGSARVAPEPAAAETPPLPLARGVPSAPPAAPKRSKSPKVSPKASQRPRSATRQGGEGVRAKASAADLDAASVALRRARAAGHGIVAILAAAQVPNTGGSRESLRDLCADPRPVRTFTRSLTLALTAGALQLAPPA